MTRDELSVLNTAIGMFNQNGYFTNEVWRRVKGFENTQRSHVHAAFLSLWLREVGVYATPCGVLFLNKTSGDVAARFLGFWRPVFDDFQKYVNENR